jgi:hypothetical protein
VAAVEYIHFRDFANKIVYAGWVKEFSETEMLRELVLRDAEIYDFDGNKLRTGQTPAFASISRTRSPRRRRLALLSWPQAAKMSRPRGVRIGALKPPSFTISAKRCMRLLELHS